MKIGEIVSFIANDSWNRYAAKIAYLPPDGWVGKINHHDINYSDWYRLDNWFIGMITEQGILEEGSFENIDLEIVK